MAARKRYYLFKKLQYFIKFSFIYLNSLKLLESKKLISVYFKYSFTALHVAQSDRSCPISFGSANVAGSRNLQIATFYKGIIQF
jgi:hypothetical protein